MIQQLSNMTDIKIIVYSWAELIEDWVTHGKEVSFVIKIYITRTIIFISSATAAS